MIDFIVIIDTYCYYYCSYRYYMQFISNTKTKRFICTETLATRIIYHLRVEPLFDADKYGMGCEWGGVGCYRSLALANQGRHTWTCTHTHGTRGGVGWVGMSTFIGTCKPRVAQIVHTELPVGWGGVGWDVKAH